MRHTTSATSQDQVEAAESKEHKDFWNIAHSLNYNMWSEEEYKAMEADGDQTVFPELVHNPPHYKTGDIECIDYLKDNLPKEAFKGYLEGNVKKYLHRWRYKNKPSEDLNKARWYLDRLIKETE